MAIVSVTNLFVIMSEPTNSVLANAISTTYPNDYIQVRPGQWIVAAASTAKEVSDALRITSGETGSAIICAVSGYYGRASTQVWEWMASKMGRTVNG